MMRQTPSTRPHLSDAEVIHRSLTDAERFEVIFDRHFEAIHAFASRRAAASDPADIAGETFRIAFERRKHYDLSFEDALPWLYGIARNLVRRRLDQERRRRTAYAAAAAATVHLSDPEVQVVGSLDNERALYVILRTLEGESAEAVEALRLHVWEELSYEDVARVLGIPIGTVRSRIHRLRNRLRAELLSARNRDLAAQAVDR